VGTAEAGREAELLALADRDIRPVLSGCREQGEADRVNAGDGEGAVCVGGGGEGLGILDQAEKVGLLEDDCRDPLVQLCFELLGGQDPALRAVL